MSYARLPLLSTETYQEFFEKFMLKNRPCMFAENITKEWKCRQEWVEPDGSINYTFLLKNFGEAVVPVSVSGKDSYGSEEKRQMPFSEYIAYLRDYENSSEVLYLKDWHFVRTFPEYAAYKTPVYFESDYLSDYCETQEDDFKFLYFGPKGSSTSPHVDVYSSYSWSANVAGRKKWYLICPKEAAYLKTQYGPVPDDISNLCRNSEVDVLEVIQNPGEIIFVPSGWLHQVVNLENTLSVNQNWFNATNLKHVWIELKNAVRETKLELSDLRDLMEVPEWNSQCQKLVKANYGMNYCQFLKVIDSALNRLFNNDRSSLFKFRRDHEIETIKSLMVDHTLSDEFTCLEETVESYKNTLCKIEKL